VPSFSASKYLITNGEFFEFVRSGGYRDSGEKYWSDDGWRWKQFRNAKNPFFWDLDGPAGSHQYKLRTIFETLDHVPWNWPVDVNYHEATAYCNWKNEQSKDANGGGFRVITEAEHHLIRDDSISLDAVRKEPECDRVLKWGGSDFASETSVPGAANLNLAYGSQSPVDALMPSTSGHHDTMGNAWEWTEDHFNPLNEFEAHAYYDDFSTPCFDGRHHMIAGGSFISTGDEASVFARFHFRPHFLQHSSFRLVQSTNETPATTLIFEDGTSSGNGGAPMSSNVDTNNTTDGGHVVRTSSAVGGDAASAIASDEAVDIYESTALVDQYLGLHYPSSGVQEGVSAILEHNSAPMHALEFPQRVAQLAAKLRGNERSTGRALDIGCAVVSCLQKQNFS
jgi:formylglycine-generating enzyme required for sulfatase activity